MDSENNIDDNDCKTTHSTVSNCPDNDVELEEDYIKISQSQKNDSKSGNNNTGVWWTLPIFETNPSLSLTTECYCKSPAKTCTVSKNGHNKGK